MFPLNRGEFGMFPLNRGEFGMFPLNRGEFGMFPLNRGELECTLLIGGNWNAPPFDRRELE